jgi:hypothetical protein
VLLEPDTGTTGELETGLAGELDGAADELEDE